MSRPVKIALIVVSVLVGIYVAASLALTGLTAMQVSGNEVSAVGSVRAVISGQMTFAASQCIGRYAPNLTTLGTPPTGSSTAFLSPDLTVADRVQKSGYLVTIEAPREAPEPNIPAECAGAVRSFVVTATPVEPGKTGIRYFRGNSEGEVVEATRPDFSDAKPVR